MRMTTFLLWNLAGFGGALVANSFVEWFVHRFIMHKPSKLIPYGYAHTTSHHRVFGPGPSYHVLFPEMRDHGIGFTWREYVLFPIFCTALYLPVQLLTGKPVYLGALAAVFAGLIAFDVLHRRFHDPRNTWFQRSRVFRFLKEHHRLHHADMTRNFNVTMPLADLCLGTLRVK